MGATSLALLAIFAALGVGVAQLAKVVDTGGGSTAIAGEPDFGEAEEPFSEEPEYESEPEYETAEVDARGYPQQSRAQMSNQMLPVLLGYHEAIVGGEFQRAWRLLTARKRRQALREQGYAKWREAQGSLSPYLEPQGMRMRLVALEGDGVARVDVAGMGWSAPGATCSEWSGLTWVRYEGGAWHYDPGYSTTPRREREWKDRYGELMGTNC